MEIQEAKTIIECLLFVSDKPLSLAALKALLEDLDRREILAALDELKAEYDTQGRAFHLAEIAEGYQLVTRVSLAPWIRKLYRSRASNKLSRAALETMAIIAYRQPISKMEVEDIRGVSADGVLNSLLERKLIRVVGRKEVVGRPLLYGTTKEFLHYFGLKDLSDMPELKDLQDMLKQDEAGEDWELNPEGQLIARMKVRDEEGPFSAAGSDPAGAAETAAAPEYNMADKTEVTMQPYQETQLGHHEGGSLHPLAAGIEPELAGGAVGGSLAPKRGPHDGYVEHWGDDEDLQDDPEDDDEDTLGGELDEEDEDDEITKDDEDEEEDDLEDKDAESDDEDDEDEDEDDDDDEDEDEDDKEEDDELDDDDDDDKEEDDDEDDEEEDEKKEDDEDLDDIDDLGSDEEPKPKRGPGRRK